jgi:hypothetical protein
MSEYQAYLIGRDGQFHRSILLACKNDTEAKEYAKQFVNGCDVELWQKDRLIDRFKSEE